MDTGALVCQACRASVSRARHLAPDNQRARKTVLVQAPDIRYARSGDVAIAYSILGDGPIDLVAVHGFAGTGIGFQDRGLHELKGVPGEWRLYAAIDAG
jgi:hypothetical protein